MPDNRFMGKRYLRTCHTKMIMSYLTKVEMSYFKDSIMSTTQDKGGHDAQGQRRYHHEDQGPQEAPFNQEGHRGGDHPGKSSGALRPVFAPGSEDRLLYPKGGGPKKFGRHHT